MSAKIDVQELVYKAKLQITGETDFGISLQAALSDPTSIPPEGVRVDIPVTGQIDGPRVKGKISGTDYLFMRGDGVSKLHVHAVIETDDGARISLFADGVATMMEGVPKAKLSENVSLHTAAAKYVWVNRVQIWATGETDLTNGQITLEAYAA